VIVEDALHVAHSLLGRSDRQPKIAGYAEEGNNEDD
jgi:hypothetical protein